MAFFRFLTGLAADRRGITALEYAIMASAIAAVLILGVAQVSGGVAALLTTAKDQVPTAPIPGR